MYEQMGIYDFIERPKEPRKSVVPECEHLVEKLFGKVSYPVAQCVNCLCERCVNNVEEVWQKVRPEEQREPCFNCDECRHYTGNTAHRTQRKEDCSEFVISDYAAKLKRKKIKRVE